MTKDITGPLNVYYMLKNFYQNHRRYVSSRNSQQLMGQDLTASDVKLNCDPLYQSGNLTLNPCGLIASSFFNDVITLTSSSQSYKMDESDISWQSDRDKKFLQVKGFQMKQLTTAVNSSSYCKNVSIVVFIFNVQDVSYQNFVLDALKIGFPPLRKILGGPYYEQQILLLLPPR